MSEHPDEPTIGMADAVGRIVHGDQWAETKRRNAEREAALDRRTAALDRRFDAETRRIERTNAWHGVLLLTAVLGVVLAFLAGVVVLVAWL